MFNNLICFQLKSQTQSHTLDGGTIPPDMWMPSRLSGLVFFVLYFVFLSK